MSANPIKATIYRKQNRSGTVSFVVRHGKNPNGGFRVKVFGPNEEQQAKDFLEEWNRRLAAEVGSLHLLEEVHQHEIRLALKKLDGTGVGILQAVEFFLRNTNLKHPRIPFSIGVDHFISSLKERKRSAEYISSINATTLKPFQLHIKDKLLSEITKENVRVFLKVKRNWSAYTQHSHRRNLSTYFNYLVREGFLISNPCENIILPRQVKKRVDFWKPHEVFIQLQYCLEKQEYKTLAAIVLSAFIGPRLREASRIKWKQVTDLSNIEVLPAQAKTFKRRLINVSKTASFWLSLIPENFREPESTISSLSSITNTAKNIKGVLQRKGLIERRIQNGFRQAFAAHYYAKFKDERILSEIMGNSIQVIKESYSGLTNEKQSDCYFHLLPKHSYTDGLKKCYELKLWKQNIKLNPNWLYNVTDDNLLVVDIEKAKEYKIAIKNLNNFDENENIPISDFQIDVSQNIEKYLKLKLSFIKDYGFDPSSKEDFFIINETKDLIEQEIGVKMENINLD